MNKRELSPLWPVSWIHLVGEPLAWKIVLALFLGGTLIGMAFPHVRAARILSFLAVFQFSALFNSTGKIYHDKHIWVLVSLVLIFLPDTKRHSSGPETRAFKHRYLTVFWTAQALIGLTYTMSGLGKLIFGTWQAVKGEVGALHPQGLAIHIAENMMSRNVDTVLGGWMIDHAILTYPCMLLTLYIQFLAVVAMCRPALHRWWGFGLLFFHIGTGLFMSILTVTHALALVLLFVGSPFAAPGEWMLRESLAALPIFGVLFRKWFQRAKITNRVPQVSGN